MKLHDLQVGDRFTFSDKHRGKVFEVTGKDRFSVVYMDVATEEDRIALSNRKTFRKEVELVTDNRVVELNDREIALLGEAISGLYLDADNDSERSEINRLYLKITGSAGRRVVLPDDVNPPLLVGGKMKRI